MAAFAGKNSRITYNSVNLLATRWVLTFKLDEIDITNFESPTATINTRVYSLNQYLGGFFEYQFDVDAFWDQTEGVFLNPPDIFPGALSGIVRLFPDRVWGTADTKVVKFTDPFVTNVVAQTDVRGAVSYNFSMKNGKETTSRLDIGSEL